MPIKRLENGSETDNTYEKSKECYEKENASIPPFWQPFPGDVELKSNNFDATIEKIDGETVKISGGSVPNLA
jgi:hypothetical protein